MAKTSRSRASSRTSSRATSRETSRTSKSSRNKKKKEKSLVSELSSQMKMSYVSSKEASSYQALPRINTSECSDRKFDPATIDMSQYNFANTTSDVVHGRYGRFAVSSIIGFILSIFLAIIGANGLVEFCGESRMLKWLPEPVHCPKPKPKARTPWELYAPTALQEYFKPPPPPTAMEKVTDAINEVVAKAGEHVDVSKKLVKKLVADVDSYVDDLQTVWMRDSA